MLLPTAYAHLLRISLIAATAFCISSCDSLQPEGKKATSRHGAKSSASSRSKAAKKRAEQSASAKRQNAGELEEKKDAEIRGGFR
ncbi:MAG: hypothetical protein M3Y80_00475 [Verrucomicrobiota bacterium]|nr:hypothetical protein [Verrucomicrobiota bacterium]